MLEPTTTNFRLLRSMLEDRMNGLDRAAPGQAGETELMKTYVLETTEHELSDGKLRIALKDIFTSAPSDSFKSLKAVFSHEDRLMVVSGKYRRFQFKAYIDFRDPRFLRLHSTSRSEILDDLVLGWTNLLPQLDHAWFDDTFLDWCSALGEFRGIAIEFSNQPLTAPEADDADEIERGESIRLRQSGKAKKMLNLLRESDEFDQQSSLAMVRIRRERAADLLTSEVRFDGRVSGRGTSFSRHTEIIETIVERYKSRVLEVEKQFGCSAVSRGGGGGYALLGRPIRINLQPHVQNLELFCSRLFGAVNPFRLSGVPRRVAIDHYVVSAIDLHTTQTLRFELRPDRMFVFLPCGTCGNSLLRLITNLQRHHSRLVSAPELSEGRVALQP